MKLLFATALLVASGGQTLSYYCSEPSKPSIPSGYYAERYEMESAKDDVDRYIRDVNEYIDCLNEEAEDARNDARRVVDEWDNAVSDYNNRQ
jgi:hypothetical protein